MSHDLGKSCRLKSSQKMKQSIDSLQTPEEIFCEIISNLNEKNEIKIINNILSYLSPKEIVLISFQTTEKLKKIMTENENPFLPFYLKNIYISKKSPQNFFNLNLFRNQIDYFSILMGNRIFEISSYFNMKHIYCIVYLKPLYIFEYERRQ